MSRISFRGPAAEGLAPGREPSAADLLDLFDERIHVTCWPDDPYELQFAGIAALIVCCGASPEEIVLIETSDIDVKNVPRGANLDREARVDNGLWLGQGSRRRRVWVPEIARMTLARVMTGATVPVDGCTKLFLSREGTPLTWAVVHRRFVKLGRRLGLGDSGLPGRMLHLLETSLETSPDVAAAFLARRTEAITAAREPWGRGDPDIVAMRKAFENSSHPLRKLTRDILQHVRPLERAYPDREFRRLSPETKAAVEAVRAAPKSHCYPPELVEAVRAAKTAGRHKYETAAHYGIPVTSVVGILRGSGPGRQTSGMGPRLHQEIFLTHARRNGQKPLVQIREWLEDEHGIVASMDCLRKIARREGLKFPHSRHKLNIGRVPQRLQAHIRKHPEHTSVEVKAWIGETLGRDVDIYAVHQFARFRGLKLASSYKLGKEKVPAVAAHLEANPQTEMRQLIDWIGATFKVQVTVPATADFLKRNGLKVKPTDRSVSAEYGPGLLAWAAENPQFEFAQAAAWVRENHSDMVTDGSVRSFLRKHGVAIGTKKRGGRRPGR